MRGPVATVPSPAFNASFIKLLYEEILARTQCNITVLAMKLLVPTSCTLAVAEPAGADGTTDGVLDKVDMR